MFCKISRSYVKTKGQNIEQFAATGLSRTPPGGSTFKIEDTTTNSKESLAIIKKKITL